MIIAVDFDGTIVEHRYPAIGKEKPFATDALKRLQSEGNILILWSVREGNLLADAVSWCRSRGLEFYAVNSNHPDDSPADEGIAARKLKADIFIDDRNIGGLPDWGVIYEMVHNGWTLGQYIESVGNAAAQKPQRCSFWHRLTGR